ncbi:MAG: DUF192 domain-containing protein [Burkholderiales bacterium]
MAGTLAVASSAYAQQSGLPVIALNAGIHIIQAEVANTDTTRATGLMFRKSLDTNRGMLFIFQVVAPHCMWMRNTFVPLSVAFLDDEGKILNIADMTPHDETSHCASGSARYALEMNRGWFAGKGVKAGNKLGGLEKAMGPR